MNQVCWIQSQNLQPDWCRFPAGWCQQCLALRSEWPAIVCFHGNRWRMEHTCTHKWGHKVCASGGGLLWQTFDLQISVLSPRLTMKDFPSLVINFTIQIHSGYMELNIWYLIHGISLDFIVDDSCFHHSGQCNYSLQLTIKIRLLNPTFVVSIL